MDFMLGHEPQIRLAVFVGLLVAMMAWELAAPRRGLTPGRGRRWPANLGIVVVNTIVVRLAVPVLPVGVAHWAAGEGWGLLNQVTVPPPLAVIAALLALDLIIFAQHIVFHKVPALWRLHRMHHADTGFDVTTGVRFHPIEILLSIAIKAAAVVALGAPAAAVMIFEVVLSATSLFNHGNVRMPASLDGLLRLVVVTPDMHRVHHSSTRAETDSNFGFNLPWWERIFGTYRAQPLGGHDAMEIGLPQFRDPGEQRLDKLLAQPFK